MREVTSHRKRVSVIVPFLYLDKQLERCLEALHSQTYGKPNLEIIAVYNSNQSLPHRASEIPYVKWIKEPLPGSFAARAAGVAVASNAILAFTDSDCLPAPDWIEKAVYALSKQSFGIVGGNIRLTPKPNGTMNECEIFESVMFGMADHRKHINERGLAVTANLVTHRCLFDIVGNFDPSIMSGGDADWVLRAKLHGASLSYSDDAIVYHPRRSTWISLLQKIRRIKGGMVKRARKCECRSEKKLLLVHFTYLHYGCVRKPLSQVNPRQLGLCISVLLLSLAVMTVGTFETVRVYCRGTPSRV